MPQNLDLAGWTATDLRSARRRGGRRWAAAAVVLAMLVASAAVGAAVVRRRGGARPSDLRTGNGLPTSGPSTTRSVDAGLAPGVTVAFGLPADIQYLRLATQPGDHGVWALSGSLSDRPSNDPPFHGRVWHHDDRTERTRSWPVTLGARFPSIGACRTGIWLAAGDTLIKFDQTDGSLIAHALPTDTNGAESSDAVTSSPPPAIACDDLDGTVVVTTGSSANYDVFDPRSDRFTSYPLPAGTGANSVAVSSTGEIAVGLTELSPTPPGIDQADEVLLVDGIGGATRVVKVQRSTTVSATGPNFLVGGSQVIAPGAAQPSQGPFGHPDGHPCAQPSHPKVSAGRRTSRPGAGFVRVGPWARDAVPDADRAGVRDSAGSLRARSPPTPSRT